MRLISDGSRGKISNIRVELGREPRHNPKNLFYTGRSYTRDKACSEYYGRACTRGMTTKTILITGRSIVDTDTINDARVDDQRKPAPTEALIVNTSNDNEAILEQQKDNEMQGKDEEIFELDEETLQIIGEEPPKSEKELEIHASLVSRWQPWLQEGLKKEVKDALLKKYPRAGNCALEAPILNQELSSLSSCSCYNGLSFY